MTWVVFARALISFNHHHRHPPPQPLQPFLHNNSLSIPLLESYQAPAISTFYILCMFRSPTASTIQQYGDLAELV